MSSPRYNGNPEVLTRTITKADGAVLVRIGSTDQTHQQQQQQHYHTIPRTTGTARTAAPSGTIDRRTVQENNELEDTRRRQLAKNAAYRQSSTRQYIEDNNNNNSSGNNSNNVSNMETGRMIYTTVSSKQKQERSGSPNSSTQSFITRKITKGRISTKQHAGDDETTISNTEEYGNHQVNGHEHAQEDSSEWLARKKLNYQDGSSSTNLPKDTCFFCRKTVYQKERIGPIRDVLYHKQCFRCCVCGFVLNLQNFHQNSNDLDDKGLYCKSHEPEPETSRVNIKDQRIQAVLNKPKVEHLNPNIRGGPDASKVRSIDTEAVSIKGAINAPKLDRFNPNVRVNQEPMIDQYTVDDKIYVRASPVQSTVPVTASYGVVSIPVQNGTATDYKYPLEMKTAINVPRVAVYNPTVNVLFGQLKVQIRDGVKHVYTILH